MSIMYIKRGMKYMGGNNIICITTAVQYLDHTSCTFIDFYWICAVASASDATLLLPS